MQWDAGSNAGFSTEAPWIAVNPNYRSINVRSAMADADSVLNFYRSLIALRNKNEAIKYGSVELQLTNDPELLVYSREHNGSEITVDCNFSKTMRHINKEGNEQKILMSDGYNNGVLEPYGFRVTASKND